MTDHPIQAERVGPGRFRIVRVFTPMLKQSLMEGIPADRVVPSLAIWRRAYDHQATKETDQ